MSDAVRSTFGKSLSELTPEEYRIYRCASRAASYYRNHDHNKHNQRRTKKFGKRDILKALGWEAKCSACGYDRSLAALDFHHIDPTQKDQPVRAGGLTAAIEEAKKCRLLCANCHREHHANESRRGVGGRPRQALHPLVEKYLAAVGVTRQD